MEQGEQGSPGNPFGLIDHPILLLSLLLIAGCELLLGWLVPRIALPPLCVLGAVRLIQIGLVFFILAVSGKGPASIGLAPSHLLVGAGRGTVWSALFGLAAGCVWFLLVIADANPMRFLRTTLPSSAFGTALFFAVGGLIAPVAEEVVFRGIVYGYLRRWGVAVALAGTTLLFAAAHVASGIPVTQIVGGLVFAIAYEKEKNLMVPIMIHVSGNLAIFSLSLVL